MSRVTLTLVHCSGVVAALRCLCCSLETPSKYSLHTFFWEAWSVDACSRPTPAHKPCNGLRIITQHLLFDDDDDDGRV